MGWWMGMRLGLAASGGRRVRGQAICGLGIILALVVVGSTVFWPQVNLSGEFAESEVERVGLAAMDRGDNALCVKMLETATHMRRAPARAWYNLGVAYNRLHRLADAVAAYEHAAQMPDSTPDMQSAARDMRKYKDWWTKPK
jgi:cytochrome c-type biogenesis protein CcmH/NrfG